MLSSGKLEKNLAFFKLFKLIVKERCTYQAINHQLKRYLNSVYDDNDICKELMISFQKSNYDRVKLICDLIDIGLDINIKLDDGKNILMYTCKYSNRNGYNNEIIKVLLDHNIDINTRDDTFPGLTALIYSSKLSNKSSSNETIKLLLDHGANIDQQDNLGLTALMYACKYSNESSSNETVKLLLDYGANINLMDRTGYTSLIYACILSNESNNDELIKLLLDYGANINLQNFYNETALMHACKYSKSSSEKTVKLLLDYGADVNLKDKNNLTALMYACKLSNSYNKEIVKILLDHGSDLNLKDYKGNTALMHLFVNFEKHRSEILNIMLDNKYGLDLQGIEGFSTLLCLYKNNIIDTVPIKILLDYGININMQDSDGMTILMHALRLSNWNNINSTERIKILLDYKINVNLQDNNGWNALMYACEYLCGNCEIIKLLLECSSDVNHRSKMGNTAFLIFLNHSLNRNTEGLIKHFLEANVDIHYTYNRTNFFDYLSKLEHKDIYLKIIFQMDFQKRCQKTVNKDIKRYNTKFLYKPNSLRYHIGFFKCTTIIKNTPNNYNYEFFKKNFKKVFDYFGVYDDESLITKIINCYHDL